MLPQERHGLAGVLTVLLLCCAPVAFAQEAVVSEETTATSGAPPASERRVWVEVTDPRGRTPVDLTVDDLEVYEDGTTSNPRSVKVGSILERAAGPQPARFVVYLDPGLLSAGGLERAGSALRSHAATLTRIGAVELVLSDPQPQVVLETREDLILAERLAWAGARSAGTGKLQDIRRRTLAALSPAGIPPSAAEAAEIVERAIDEELTEIRRHLERLLAWAADGTPERPQVLFLLHDGFDLDPLAFYTPHLAAESLQGLRAGAERRLGLELAVQETAQALAALGWIVLPIAIEPPSGRLADRFSVSETTDQQGYTTTAPGFRIRPGARRRQASAAAESEEIRFVDPHEPLERLASHSGGEMLTTEAALRDLLERIVQRVEVTYRANPAALGVARPFAIYTRPEGWAIRSPRWSSSGTPEVVAAARLRGLLRGEARGGGLDVVSALKEDPDSTVRELEVRVSLEPLGEERQRLEGAAFRVSTAIERLGAEPLIRHEVVSGQEVASLAEWIHRRSLEVPPESRDLAVVVEELGLGRWGGRLAAIVQGDWGDDLAARPVIEIVRPQAQLLRGRVKLAADALDERVRRVVFQVGERAMAEVDRPPFEARIDLGRTPRRQTLTVIAYDGAGGELGRDSVVINAGSGGLAVEIIRPENRRGTGWVEVEARVSVPLERRLDRVLMFWNSELVGTLFQPPFRHRIFIPEESSIGFVRTLALLDDGTVAEDVVFLNSPEQGERVDVNLVELNVVVTDRSGRPVQGLTEDDFRIREEGSLQEIAVFSAAGELPLTLGMAIDSSASMFVKLPRMQRAAKRFLGAIFSDADRAFVVDFDTQPRLARGTTGDLERVVGAIERLEASGRTALWESIVFSLVQLQGVRGRKALIVFSDGADQDDEFPYNQCLQFAKKMGVPIYMILGQRQGKGQGGSLFSRSFGTRVDRLVDAVGGRVFYAQDYRDLDDVYDEIERELRSQYLLAYYPRTAAQGGWRDVDIEVEKKGLTPRTLSGYWQ